MDKVFINGKIHTMDRERNIVEAIGIKDDMIIRAGTREEVLALQTAHTVVYDLEGKTVVPGFNDSHIHLLNCGIVRNLVNLVGLESVDDLIQRMSNHIEENTIEKGKWVSGRGWNQDYFKGEKEFPTRYDLDKISLDHPIIATRACGHVVSINSKALEALNITKDTPQIEGGHFDLDGNGEPLGIFRENAITLIYENLPSPNLEEIKKLVIDTIEDMNRAGITSVGSDDFQALADKDYDKVLKVYTELKEEKRLNIRVNQQCLLPQLDKLEEFINKGYRTGQGDKFHKIGPLKLLIDGSLGARTALLIEPYSDDPDTLGISTLSQEELDNIVGLAHKNDIQVAIHAIGDGAMYMAFESIEKALAENPKEDHRHGIVHCQITDEKLLDKFAELEALAYIQPIFLDYDWKIVKDRVGEKREKTSYNWKTMVEKNINIACGSDAPVEPFNVINGIYEAVTRKDLEGNPAGGWLPEQSLTVDETIYGFTMGGAYSSFEENIKGSLEEGKLADMVVLSDDIFNVEEDKIKDIEVDMTIFGGEIVYKRD